MTEDTYKVVRNKGVSEEWRSLKTILMEFAKKVGGNIYIYKYPAFYKSVNLGARKYALKIIFNAIPESLRFRYCDSYDKIYDLPADGSIFNVCHCEIRDDKFKGKLIVDTAGTVIAAVNKKVLYVLLNINSFSDVTNQILQRILDDYYLLITDEKAFDLLMIKRIKDSQENQFLDIYQNEMNDWPDEDDIREIDSEIKDLKMRLSALVRDRAIVRNEINNDKEQRDPDRQFDLEKTKTIYDNLCKFSETGLVEVDGSRIIVPVGQIDIEYEGDIYDIGDFDVVIDFDHEDAQVKCKNKTRKVNRYYHPNVGDDGECCLGNITYGIQVLLGDMEFDTLVLMMIEFLKSYSPKNPNYSIDNWPKKNTKK